VLTLGVEEEFFVVDRASAMLAEDALPGLDVLRRRVPASFGEVAGFEREFQRSIVETRTGVCASLNEIRAQLEWLRRALVAVAAASDQMIVAAGTLPAVDWRVARVTDKPRYAEIAEHYRDVAQRRATCGCHIHVGIADRDQAVRTLNRVRPWLPLLLALSASSPFYDAADTGYESFRSLLWGAFPVAGSPEIHDSYEQYAQKIRMLVATGAILDAGHAYWDARLGTRYETLEFRIADACTTVDEAVLQVALCRAIALTCIREDERGAPLPSVPAELLRAATWRAARSGLDGTLVDVLARENVPAQLLVERLLAYVRIALEDLGDLDEVVHLVDEIRSGGTSARRQRHALPRDGGLAGVADQVAAETDPDGLRVGTCTADAG
jgi:glutamate---cysteine ligase / carboxylate-amine ligase